MTTNSPAAVHAATSSTPSPTIAAPGEAQQSAPAEAAPVVAGGGACLSAPISPRWRELAEEPSEDGAIDPWRWYAYNADRAMFIADAAAARGKWRQYGRARDRMSKCEASAGFVRGYRAAQQESQR